MTLLTRIGVSDSYTALLPNGYHLTVWPNKSCELVRFEQWVCSCKRCKDSPDGPHAFKVTNLVRRTTGSHYHSMKAALEDIAPGVDFGVRPDGTFPVRAYMRYPEALIKAHPRIKDDIPEEVEGSPHE